MHLKELKKKTPADLVAMSEEMGIEGASTMRKQDLMFSILKIQADNGVEIMGAGTIEVLNDGFGFLRSPEANYLAGPDDIYVAPSIVRRFGLRTGDTIEGEIRGPKEGERYFALTRVTQINYGLRVVIADLPTLGRRALLPPDPSYTDQTRPPRTNRPPQQTTQSHALKSHREAQ